MKNIYITFMALLLFTSCQQVKMDKHSEAGISLPTSDYLGQTPPGDSTMIFAPGIIGTGMYTRDMAISPSGDEIYYGVSLGGYTYTTILVCRKTDGIWRDPEVAPWCTDPNTMYLEPAMNRADTGLIFPVIISLKTCLPAFRYHFQGQF